MNKQRWGYGGTETACNGISKMLVELGIVKATNDANMYFKSVNEIMSAFLDSKGIKHLTRGHAINKAHYNGKLVQKHYAEFIQFAKTNSPHDH